MGRAQPTRFRTPRRLYAMCKLCRSIVCCHPYATLSILHHDRKSGNTYHCRRTPGTRWKGNVMLRYLRCCVNPEHSKRKKETAYVSPRCKEAGAVALGCQRIKVRPREAFSTGEKSLPYVSRNAQLFSSTRSVSMIFEGKGKCSSSKIRRKVFEGG